MRLVAVHARIALLGSLTLATSACQMPEPPGELVGKYSITSALLENTCGQGALPVAETLVYRAELREDGVNAYWLVGSPPARLGRVTDDNEYRFGLQQTYAVREGSEPIDPVLAEMDPIALYGYDPFGEPSEGESAPCTLLIEESVRARVLRAAGHEDDAGRLDRSDLEGENVIQMRASSGSDCRRVLETSGGPFEQLPCAARYDLSGTLLDAD
jgi:hypothetical protein